MLVSKGKLWKYGNKAKRIHTGRFELVDLNGKVRYIKVLDKIDYKQANLTLPGQGHSKHKYTLALDNGPFTAR